MRISSFLPFLKQLKVDQQFFFLFGNNDVLLNIRAHFLKKNLERLHGKSLKTRTIDHLEEMGHSAEFSLFESSQNSDVIYCYQSSSAKSLSDFQRLSIANLKGFMIWQAEKAAIKSPLVQAMDKDSSVLSIPTYQPEKGEIEYYIRAAFDQENITYTDEVMKFLVSFHEDESAALLANLDILILYGLGEKKLSRDEVQRLCQTFEAEDLKACAIAFTQSDLKVFIKKLRALKPLNVYLIPFLRFTGKMLQNALESENNPYQRSLGCAHSKAKIIVILQQFYALEHGIKSGEFFPDPYIEKTLSTFLPTSNS